MSKKFKPTNEQIRTFILYDCFTKAKAVDSFRQLCRTFGPSTVCYKMVRTWFKKFKSGNYDVDDQPRSGRPSELDDRALLELVERDTRQSSRAMAATMGCSHQTILSHLEALGKTRKLGYWVPHRLTEQNRDQRVTIASFLLSYARTFGWLDSILTGDEKWVLYVNVTRRHQWVDQDADPEPEPKAGLHQKKVMLCVWWDVRGIVYYELLPANTTVTAAVYCDQLERVKAELEKNRPGHRKIRFLHDNARPHTAKLTRDKLKELGWEVLPHPAYSPDFAPSDYHLFRSLQHFLENKEYKSREELKADLDLFFASQPQEFYSSGINKLPERWQQVVDSDGDYIKD